MTMRSVLAAGAALGALAAPVAAQNSSAEPPIVNVPPPPSKAEAPPAPPAPAPSPAPSQAPAEPPAASSPPAEVVVVPPSPPPPPAEPMRIDPDAAYPEGFADPADPFANDMSLSYRDQQGSFDWGLLGLLGLLGLVPLFRDRGGRRVVYVERDDEMPPRRVVRRERLEE